MEQVLFRLHVRTIRTVSGFLNFRMRALTEKAILFCALTSLAILYILHNAYVSPIGPNCIVSELGGKEIISDVDILAIHILNGNESWSEPSDTLKNFLYNNSYLSKFASTSDPPLKSSLKEYLSRFTTLLNEVYFTKVDSLASETYTKTCKSVDRFRELEVKETWKVSQPCENLQGSKNHINDLEGITSKRIYLFSLEKGYLLLGPDKLDKHNITRLDVKVADDHACFGPPMYAWLLRQFVGYDTVVKNWVIKYFTGNGYLYNVHSKELFDLNLVADFVTKTGTAGHISTAISLKQTKEFDGAGVFGRDTDSTNSTDGFGDSDVAGTNKDVISIIGGQTGKETNRGGDIVNFQPIAVVFGWTSILWGSVSSAQHYVAFKVGVVLTTMFLFFTMTTLVSFTLRVTQERMLKFTFLLQRHISHRIPYAMLIFTHVVESLVFVPLMAGVLFFLFEFFLDQLLAFMVLSVVWVAEVYSVIWMFFLYFSLFHIYFFCFPFGFSYLALLSTVLHLLHAMIYFWHAYEIPAFQRGLITALSPREVVGESASVSAFQMQSGSGYGETLAVPLVPGGSAAPGGAGGGGASSQQAGGHPVAVPRGYSRRTAGVQFVADGVGQGANEHSTESWPGYGHGVGAKERERDGRSSSASSDDRGGGMSVVERSRSGSGSSSGSTASSSGNGNDGAGNGGGDGRKGDSASGRSVSRLPPIPRFNGNVSGHSSRGLSPPRGSGPGSPSPAAAAAMPFPGPNGWNIPSPPRSTRGRAGHHHAYRAGLEQQATALSQPMTMQESCSRHVELSRRIQQQQMANMLGLEPAPLSPPRPPLAFAGTSRAGIGTDTAGVAEVAGTAATSVGVGSPADDSWFVGDTF